MFQFAVLNSVAEDSVAFWTKVEDYSIPIGDGLEEEADVTKLDSIPSNLVSCVTELRQAENSTSQHAD